MAHGIACDALLGIERIKAFQSASLGMKNPDGRVDPAGQTLSQLTACAGMLTCSGALVDIKALLFGPVPGNTGLLKRVKPRKFRSLYIKQAGLGLTITKGEELLVFFNFLQNDPDIPDIRWAAYTPTLQKPEGSGVKAPRTKL